MRGGRVVGGGGGGDSDSGLNVTCPSASVKPQRCVSACDLDVNVKQNRAWAMAECQCCKTRPMKSHCDCSPYKGKQAT